MTTIPTTNSITSLPASLRYIANTLKDLKKLSPGRVIRILREARVQASDLQAWEDFDHPVADSYGRKLVFDGGHFEIMVMSWRPGDFSTIHDHGHTQWGAVQIFGPAEHATFRVEEDTISTLNRWRVQPGDIVGVGHTLVHQMGNPTSDAFFLSLHVYGDMHENENVTGDARLFDLKNDLIHRIDGGVFFALPPEEMKSTGPGPVADFPTRLRHMTELARRLRKMENAKTNNSGKDLLEVLEGTFSARHHNSLLRFLKSITDDHGQPVNSIQWRILNHELHEAAKLLNEWKGIQRPSDNFHKYAEVYDAVIGKPCLESFMRRYLFFFDEKYQPGFPEKSIISLGCGTALVEEFILQEMNVPYEHLYGIDISEAMVAEARQRIQADVGDVLTLDPSIRMWDIAFSGLNVFHYLDHTRLEEAIRKTAAIVKPGGYFFGDFITPDHIRWYPHTIYSEDEKVISLRTPRLIEEKGAMFQESEIINISFLERAMEINYSGKHKRFLPPMNRIRTYFEKAFGGPVDLYDAHSLEPIPDWADSCASTRYVVVAQKEGAVS